MKNSNLLDITFVTWEGGRIATTDVRGRTNLGWTTRLYLGEIEFERSDGSSTAYIHLEMSVGVSSDWGSVSPDIYPVDGKDKYDMQPEIRTRMHTLGFKQIHSNELSFAFEVRGKLNFCELALERVEKLAEKFGAYDLDSAVPDSRDWIREMKTRKETYVRKRNPDELVLLSEHLLRKRGHWWK
jgi:hypothetical protein